MPVPDLADGIELNVADFKEMIQQVAFAASSDEARPVLQGVQTDRQRRARSPWRPPMASASRCARRPCAGRSAKPMTMIIPARALTELARIARMAKNIVTHGHPRPAAGRWSST